MDDILVVDEELVDINHGSNGSSNGKKGRHSAAKGEKKSKKKLVVIISSAAAAVIALGVAGFCVFGGNLFNKVEEAVAGEFKFPTAQPFRVFQFQAKRTMRRKSFSKRTRKALSSRSAFRLM